MDAQIPDPISWIDLTSAAMLLVFLVLGFFRGFLWQMSRLVSLLLAWILSTQFHPQMTSFLQDKLGLFREAQYATYIAFFMIFLGTLIFLSGLTMIVEKFVEKLHLTFYNRIGGGLLGVVQGAGLIMALVGLVYLVFPHESALASEVGTSRTGKVTRAVIGGLEGYFSEDLLILYGLRPPKLEFPGELPQNRLEDEDGSNPSSPQLPGDPLDQPKRLPVPGPDGQDGKDG